MFVCVETKSHYSYFQTGRVDMLEASADLTSRRGHCGLLSVIFSRQKNVKDVRKTERWERKRSVGCFFSFTETMLGKGCKNEQPAEAAARVGGWWIVTSTPAAVGREFKLLSYYCDETPTSFPCLLLDQHVCKGSGMLCAKWKGRINATIEMILQKEPNTTRRIPVRGPLVFDFPYMAPTALINILHPIIMRHHFVTTEQEKLQIDEHNLFSRP